MRQKPLWPYIADFYCAQYRLCIEVDGSSHHSKEEYDTQRTAYLNDNHIRVIRFTNDEIESDVDKVVEYIQSVLGG